MRPMIQIEALVKRFGDVTAVGGVTFEARAGEVTGFLGPNGAGKTTTMRVLATLLNPTEGSVRVAGFDTVREAEQVRRSIGLLTEETGLYDKMTAREQLEFFGSLYDLGGAALARRVDDLAEMLGFSENLDRRAGTLSKGNRQKVAVARALVHDPPVLLLDEPTAALDVVASNAMEGFMTGDALRGKCVLLSTHIAEEAARLCARIVVIARGAIVAAGAPDDIVERARTKDLRGALLELMGDPNGAPV